MTTRRGLSVMSQSPLWALLTLAKRIMAKVHHGNNLSLDVKTLRAAARGELGEPDPIRESLEQSRKERREAMRAATTVSPVEAGKTPVEASRPPAARKDAQPAAPQHGPSGGAGRAEARPDPEALRKEREALEQKRRELLRLVALRDALDVVNDELLAMRDYPDTANLLIAKRKRDLWLLAMLMGLAVFLIGWMGFAPAWIAGTGFAVMVASGLTWVPPVRRLFSKAPTYEELRATRRLLEYRALAHLKLLEGGEPLVWKLQALAPWNPRLEHPRYARLVSLSHKRLLLRAVESAAAFRLYLEYIIEARRAMQRVEEELATVRKRIRELDDALAG